MTSNIAEMNVGEDHITNQNLLREKIRRFEDFEEKEENQFKLCGQRKRKKQYIKRSHRHKKTKKNLIELIGEKFIK